MLVYLYMDQSTHKSQTICFVPRVYDVVQTQLIKPSLNLFLPNSSWQKYKLVLVMADIKSNVSFG